MSNLPFISFDADDERGGLFDYSPAHLSPAANRYLGDLRLAGTRDGCGEPGCAVRHDLRRYVAASPAIEAAESRLVAAQAAVHAAEQALRVELAAAPVAARTVVQRHIARFSHEDGEWVFSAGMLADGEGRPISETAWSADELRELWDVELDD